MHRRRRTRRAGSAMLSAIVLGGLVLSGCTDGGATGPGSATGADAAPASSALPTASAITRLAVGDCTGELDLSGTAIVDVPTVSCSGAHNWEVHAVVSVTADSYPGATAIEEQAQTACAASFVSYVGVAPRYSRYTSAYLAGDENSWALPANRVIACLAGSADTEQLGSARGDTRVFPKKGQCTGRQDVAAGAVEIIDCSAKHYYEVYAVKAITSDKAPTQEAEHDLYTSVCVAGFKNFVGVDLAASRYEIAYFLAGEDIWNQVADHRIVCSAGSPTGGIKGTLKDAKK